MTKQDLLDLVKSNKSEHEPWYLDHGPNKREQEEHYQNGVSVVEMNVDLLDGWLSCQPDNPDAHYHALPKADRREIWEASDFHFGIMGYEDHDADFYWEHYA